MNIIYSVIFLSITGFIFAVLLGYAAKKFTVKKNPVEEKISGLLAGANCGACGFAGCAGYAEALCSGKAEPGKCSVVSKEVNEEIAILLGKEIIQTSRKIAVIFCNGGNNCKDKFIYTGIENCSVANNFAGGFKECIYGCLTLGDCARVCQFGAITYQKGKVPVIDPNKCVGCGKCVEVCPKKIIHLVECKYNYHILCSSFDKGGYVRQTCSTGCIGCGICVKNCPQKDIKLENNLAKMLYNKCNNCNICFDKCPTKAIQRITLFS